MSTSARWFSLVVSVLPLGTNAAEIEVAVRSGSQSQAVVSGTLVAFTDSSGAFPQVWSYDLGTNASGRIAPLDAMQQSPAVSGSMIAYLDYRTTHPEIWIWDAVNGSGPRVTYPPAIPGAPAASGRVLAWRDLRGVTPRLWVLDFNTGQVLAIGNTVTDTAIAASGPLVVYTGEDGQSVMLYSADSTTATVLAAGPARSPHLDGDQIAFVDLAADADGDLAVVSKDGTRLAALPLAGEQRLPRISGDWVAFEDMGTGGRLAIWNWRTGRVYYPAPAGTTQSQSDLSYPWVVYTDQRNGQDDVYAQKLDLETPDGGPGGTVSCDDPSVVPLATLTVTVPEAQNPYDPHHCHWEPPHHDLWAVGQVEFQSPSPLPVLVCIDGSGEQKGFATLDALLLAGPAQLGPGVSHLEAQAVACAGTNRLEAGLTGDAGATLTVRVLANPGADPGDGGTACCPGGPDGGTDCDRSCAHGAAFFGGGCGGCASGGGAGLLTLLGGGLLLMRRRRPAGMT